MTRSRPDWCAELSARLEQWEAMGRQRRLHTTSVLPGHRVRVAGRTYLNFASNDYLGLGGDPAPARRFLADACGEHLLDSGLFTASASRLLGGEHAAYDALEHALAEAYGHDRQALVFNSGYHANIGILPALAERDDLVLADRHVHASLIDGLRLCRAHWIRYRHNDLNHLEDLLTQRSDRARRTFIVTESIFSMDGDAVDLRLLTALKQRFGAILVLDEAHSVGVRGKHGLGLAEEQGVLAEVDILVGTFGKALASSGAFAIVAPEVRAYLINTARSLIFTTAMPPIQVWWTRHVLQQVLAAADLRQQLRARVEAFRSALGRETHTTHIVPFPVGEDTVAVRLSAKLRDCGYWVPPVRPPTVPEGTARLRFSLGADMDMEQLRQVATTTLAWKESL